MKQKPGDYYRKTAMVFESRTKEQFVLSEADKLLYEARRKMERLQDQHRFDDYCKEVWEE